MTERCRYLILGAGPAGLGAARRLLELDCSDFLVIEEQDAAGGLSASVVDEKGFTWDYGGHVQFSHYPYYDAVLDEVVDVGWLWHDRESWIWIRNRFVPYPFQNNIHRLDPVECERALRGMERAAAVASGTRPSNFSEWLSMTFGDELCRVFFFPYNGKVWGVDLESMDWSWIGERIAVPDVERIRSNIRERQDDVSWGPNNRFRFPVTGGTGAIWTGVATRLPQDRIHYRDAAAVVDPGRREVRTTRGNVIAYDRLISTIPLDSLCGMTVGVSRAAVVAAQQLQHRSLHVVGVGLDGGMPPSIGTKCWMYFPEPNSPYFRVTVFSNYSPNNVPRSGDKWSLMAEVCETAHRPEPSTGVTDAVLKALHNDGLIGKTSRVDSLWHRRLEHAYPTPTLGRDDALRRLHQELQGFHIYSRGRFGGWKYEIGNQDHCFMQGVELAEFLVQGTPEKIYHVRPRI